MIPKGNLVCFIFSPDAAEMSIIEDCERNQQFEQQYISSVVEGLEEALVICPTCRK